MKIPHFFKLRSRLGLLNPPHHSLEVNRGVEEGPDAILSDKFLALFPETRVDVFDFPLPENVTVDEYERVIAESSRQCRDLILSLFQPGEISVVIGGDHSVTFPSFLATLARFENVADIGYIQFDSHGDMHLRQTSLTDNFHGMYVRAFLDPQFDMPEVSSLIKQRLPKENVLFVGNLDLDATGERQYFDTQNIAHISKEDARERRTESVRKFEEFANRFKHVHVTCDIDAFDKTIAPATGIPAEDGLFLEDIEEMLRVIAKHPSFSFDIAEVNPQKSGAEQTVLTAQKILSNVLGAEDTFSKKPERVSSLARF